MSDRRTSTGGGERGSPRPPLRSGETLGVAHAPYNFVMPLPAAAADAPPSADRYHDGRYSGHIDLQMTTETPLYIRGTAGIDQLDQESKDLPNFFSPTGRPAIPGSSLRGMLRSLLEIVSGSALSYVTDNHYAFRAVAEHASSSLTTEYRRRLGADRVQAGYLTRSGGRLRLLPAQRLAGRQFWRVRRDTARERLNLRSLEWLRRQVYFQVPPSRADAPADGIPLVTELRLATGDLPEGWADGWLVLSGDIQGKKHGWIVAGPDTAAPPRSISEEDEHIYRESWSPRLEALAASSDFPLLPSDSAQLPCFYAAWMDSQGSEHLSFGHTRWFRVPYEHGVQSRIPAQAQKPEAAWDLAQAVFGRVGDTEQTWGGRLFVEDAPLVGNPDAAILAQALPKVLSSPKPTTFQHYLSQDRAAASGGRRDLQHWDSPDAAIRGYKLYWHRPEVEWRETNPDRAQHGDTQGTPIRPIRPQTHFLGRLRFENLSGRELGALCFVVRLPDTCRHRLGMGKPLGLGTIHIHADLHLDDRQARYRALFSPSEADGSMQWAEPVLAAAPSADDVRRDFAVWLLTAAGDSQTRPVDDPVAAAWDGPLLALKALLTWDGAPKPEQTAYMPLVEFRGRPVLPDPLAVIDWRASTRSAAGRSPVLPAAGHPTTTARPPTVPQQSAPPRPSGPPPPTLPPPPEQLSGPATLDDLVRKFGRQPERPAQRPGDTREGRRARQEQQRIMQQQRRQPPDPTDPKPG